MAASRYRRGKPLRAPVFLKIFFLLTLTLLLWTCFTISNSRFYDMRISSVTTVPSYNFETDNIMGLLLEADIAEFAEKFEMQFDNITLPPSGFLVWNNKCHIPEVEIISNALLKELHPMAMINCSYGEPFISKIYDSTTNSYHLRMNFKVKYYFVGVGDTISCCYKEIIRKETDPEQADKLFRLMACINFNDDFEVPYYIQYGIIVECRSVARNELVYMDAFSFVQKPKRPKIIVRPGKTKKMNNNNKYYEYNVNKNKSNFGLLIFGIDGLSQFNFRRTMPRFYTELKRNHWFELSGYNKIDDNTFPNLMAILTGYNLSRAKEVCRPEEVGGLDNCTTAFKLFRDHGFKTAYAEDETEMSTFVYLRKGFRHPPTTFYLRPFMIAIEETLKHEIQSKLKFCIGWHRAAEYIYDFGVEFADRYRNQSIFGLFWSNSFSHNHYLDPTLMDLRMYEYFRDMRQMGLLENNVVIVLSDHGARWGTLRNLPQGYIEERMPMFFVWLPKRLQLQHPEFVYALRVNKHRLTSPYDIHMTLRHFLQLTTNNNNNLSKAYQAESCPTCQTIFEPVPEMRGCTEAGITEHWCTCHPFISVSTDTDHIKKITESVIEKINRYVNMTMPMNICQPLELYTITEVNRKVENVTQNANTYNSKDDDDSDGDRYKSPLKHYRIRFVVSPNEAEFEVTVLYNRTTRRIKEFSVPSVSRLNVYAEDSKCLNDGNILKKFCICKEEKPTQNSSDLT